ncbi:MAG: hypothetical protein KKF44_07485 [Nanoarchaeota archaeon]|nr:hypothetical protein [Nanoarchaeota archaeon]
MIEKIIIPIAVLAFVFYYFNCQRNPKKSFVCIYVTKKFTRLQIGFLLMLLFFFLLFQSLFVFGLLVVFSAVLNTYQNRLGIPFDISPSLVLMILISMKLGFWFGLAYLILGYFIPSVLVGGFDYITFMFVSLAGVVCFLASLPIPLSTLYFGVILILFQSIFAFIIASMSADPKNIFSVFLGFVMNIMYFSFLNEIIHKILS